MPSTFKFILVLVAVTLLAACGGGGGGSVTLTADAGQDQIVDAGANVALSAANTTVSGSTVSTYNWVQLSGPAVTINNPTSVVANFFAPVQTSASSLQFELTVTTVSGATDTDLITITT